MPTPSSLPSRLPRHSALAACLATALGLAASTAIGGPNQVMHRERAMQRELPRAAADMMPVVPAYLRAKAAEAEAANPSHPGAVDHLVTSCLDDGSAGTLRSVIEDPMTGDGDSINLTQLMCSKITLNTTPGVHGAIRAIQSDLHIHGPGADQLSIDGNHLSSIFYHSGSSTLGISDVTITNGYYVGNLGPKGGCIYSTGNVLLMGSVVSNCVLGSSTANAFGGGVYTLGYLTLFNSMVTGNHILTTGGARASGGGAFVLGDLTTAYSTVSGNSVAGVGNAFPTAGGVFSAGNVDIEGSTVSGNRAGYIAGIDIVGGPFGFTAKIINSTISSNTAGISGGGIYSEIPLTLANSTVAFNTSGSSTQYTSGVHMEANLTLQSSIIASNAAPEGQSDLGGPAGVVVTGDHSLVTSFSQGISVPAGVVVSTACPRLDPLANNGGPTQTHKLRHSSPAIDQGAAGTLVFDQRRAQRTYPNNGQADIGAVEWQPTDVDDRLLSDGFEKLCDR